MPVTIVTPPDAAANSYVNLADAEIYHESILNNTEWTAAIDDTKNRALVMATRLLEPNLWKGTKTDTLADNALSWPRFEVFNSDGQELDGNTVPEILENATAQLAFELIKTDRITDVGASKAAGVKVAKVGPLEIENFEGDNDGSYLAPIPVQVYEMIAPLLAAGYGRGVAQLIRG